MSIYQKGQSWLIIQLDCHNKTKISLSRPNSSPYFKEPFHPHFSNQSQKSQGQALIPDLASNLIFWQNLFVKNFHHVPKSHQIPSPKTRQSCQVGIFRLRTHQIPNPTFLHSGLCFPTSRSGHQRHPAHFSSHRPHRYFERG